MVDFAEDNPFLARLRRTRHRLEYYARTHDTLSLERTHDLALARIEALAELPPLRAALRVKRARFIALHRELHEKHGVAPGARLLRRLFQHFFKYFDSDRFLCQCTPPPYRLTVRGRVHELSLLGEARLKMCVAAYGEWREGVKNCRRRTKFLREQARGGFERSIFAQLRWRRLKLKWRAMRAWKDALEMAKARRAQRTSAAPKSV